ncbi:endonuclease [Ignicoccus pacificus DSM 13166]|uniref:Endonuclease n=1 Tax=Ignicoccus pacificus DSM 13166 TaxID=940294 RepID=A0A977KAL7_9CREN|nr:endonuclease [Ignicoccus pacificus DSM 13166]
MVRRGKSSEELAKQLLQAIGFDIIESNKEIIINGRVIAEVDIYARAPCSHYAVEVKAGKVDVGAVRQAYANAKALNAIPMVMGSGWANEEARLLAEKLDVKYLLFDDLFVSTKEELYDMIRIAMEEVIADVVGSVRPSEEACKLLELEEGSEEFLETLKRLKKEGILPKRGTLKLYLALAQLSCYLAKPY